jgi:hypothetical protein
MTKEYLPSCCQTFQKVSVLLAVKPEDFSERSLDKLLNYDFILLNYPWPVSGALHSSQPLPPPPAVELYYNTFDQFWDKSLDRAPALLIYPSPPAALTSVHVIVESNYILSGVGLYHYAIVGSSSCPSFCPIHPITNKLILDSFLFSAHLFATIICSWMK